MTVVLTYKSEINKEWRVYSSTGIFDEQRWKAARRKEMNHVPPHPFAQRLCSNRFTCSLLPYRTSISESPEGFRLRSFFLTHAWVHSSTTHDIPSGSPGSPRSVSSSLATSPTFSSHDVRALFSPFFRSFGA